LSTIDKGDRFEYVNVKFTEILGYTLEDIPRAKTGSRRHTLIWSTARKCCPPGGKTVGV